MKLKGTLLGFLFLVLMVIVIIPSIYLIVYNSDSVSVDLLVYETDTVNLGTLLLLTWLLASLVGFISGLGIPSLVGRYLETRKLEKKLDSMEQELNALKAQTGNKQVQTHGK